MLNFITTVDERKVLDMFRYDKWVAKGLMYATPGNVIDYAYIEKTIEELSEKYHIMEIAY